MEFVQQLGWIILMVVGVVVCAMYSLLALILMRTVLESRKQFRPDESDAMWADIRRRRAAQEAMLTEANLARAYFKAKSAYIRSFAIAEQCYWGTVASIAKDRSGTSEPRKKAVRRLLRRVANVQNRYISLSASHRRLPVWQRRIEGLNTPEIRKIARRVAVMKGECWDIVHDLREQ